ncbi:DNA topoisomerase III [Jeotgalibacillus sp. R-1-5s-1]|uniref:DNA topoisomerase III n=1 Tax=Jeotgalibacillus sp. R-1-5s-1 TaxID=2555897 RepID=UPI00106DD02B|nr:DNA topoisomerase III [Jeotgalibacillus sp. R-1-5s-1]TFD92854.1 DNA topoisomerase III [Jeotgalibacillus sp. R-1-5s-1]
MKKTVVLAEKPSVGRDIARVLNCHKKGNGYLEGDQYIVTWALGHLVTHADPENYGDQYQSWKLEDLPILPDPMKLVVIKKTGKQFQAVKSQLTRGDVGQIVIATDAGREGELVARWIIEKARVNKPVKRLWISSVTDKAIREGFKNLKDGKQYESLYASAVARAEADWIVGINATRALTTKFNAQLSSGRVQTPTIAMIAMREEEIRQFKPKTYYGLQARLEGFQLKWADDKGQSSTFNEQKVDGLLAKLKGSAALIKDVKKTPKKMYAKPLYDLTELQRDAHKRYGFSAKETLSTLQKLYEQHKLVTYPRTDSRYLSSDLTETLADRLKGMKVNTYAPHVVKLLRNPIKASSRFINDAKVSDHHAIIPTEETLRPEKLNDKEWKIYDLIAERFLSVLMPAYEYEQTVITADIAGETFTAKGNIPISLGFKELDQREEEGVAGALPPVEKGSKWTVQNLSETTGETQPPARFNEATLLSAMENPKAFMSGEKKELVQTLGETGGLGTVATRADIIEKLFNSFLIEKRGNDIFLTSKGRQLLDLVPDELRSPALTAQWEQKLSAIADGKLKQQEFMKEMTQFSKDVVRSIKNSKAQYKHDNMTGTHCPDCGKLMLEVNGKKGKMLVCQDRECGHRKNVAKKTNARCPNCKKKMDLRGEGEAQTFSCVCGYREKMDAFHKRRKQNTQNKAGKRDVANYMKKQNKEEEPINSALADALKNLKL